MTAGVKPVNDGETIMEQLALTVAEACAAARIGRTTLYEAIKRGDLVAAKYGRKTLIRVDDLRSWLASLPTVETICKNDKTSKAASHEAAPRR
jgi:excisionase family DNA binding protein